MWLRALIAASNASSKRFLYDGDRHIEIRQLGERSTLGGHLEELSGRSVLLGPSGQAAAAIALAELDGVARRIVVCTPDLPERYFAQIAADAEVDAWVGSADRPLTDEIKVGLRVSVGEAVSRGFAGGQTHETEWVLLTSGTTGAPKLVLHSLASLTNAFLGHEESVGDVVWATFYDIRRYGGLQIFLRGLRAGSMVLANPAEPVGAFLRRVASMGATHISGTPSHWRKALMSGATTYISPSYIRLSGEIADQGILDSLRAAFPKATVAHAFASTEAGVGFEVRDGQAGFPAQFVASCVSAARIDVGEGTLRLRSPGNAVRYLGADAPALKSPDGFVDTGDRLELREGRYYFVGRSGGVINVGGLKVYPEEVEAIINSHPRIRASRVAARRSPITGAVVVAEVVKAISESLADGGPDDDQLKREITAACREALLPHKVPATIKFVPSLEVSESGKLVRANA